MCAECIVKRVSLLSTLILVGIGAVFAQSSPRDLFEQARMLDESNQHLTEAIALYQHVASLAGDERALAAHAQLRAGLLYDRMGKTTEAERVYIGVMDTFADQPAMAAEAQSRLAALHRQREKATLDGITIRRVWAGPKIAGGDPEVLLESPRMITGFSVHPDGDRIAYSIFEQDIEIWMMEGLKVALEAAL
jgi:hypothetical protein